MKRQLKTVAAFAAAAAMTMASVMTASAEVVTEGQSYSLSTENGNISLTFSKSPQVPIDEYDKQLISAQSVEGYEWKSGYVYYNGLEIADCGWEFDVEHAKDGSWEDTGAYVEAGGLYHTHNFTISYNGTDYTQCKFLYGCMLSGNNSNEYYNSVYVLVPKGYNGKIWYSIGDEGAKQATFYLNDDCNTSTTSQGTAAWKQDSKGWWVERPDGSYLVNEWYQSPESGLWYYMGADGYMLTNTITPDGYTVNADGVWEQEKPASVQQTDDGKDMVTIQTALKLYTDYIPQNSSNSLKNYVLADLDGDGIPECIRTDGDRYRIVTCVGNEVKSAMYDGGGQLFYLKGGNVFCRYYESTSAAVAPSFSRRFYKFDKNSEPMFNQIGASSANEDSSYSLAGSEFRNGFEYVTKERFDEYNNRFGTLTEIPLDSAHTYKSIDEAYEAFIAQ
ncbi:hypothetical protein D3Z58_20645 [Clostridiaceae bacterium]|nr:hypothetical protein [Clostridiaceae bacterium]